MVTRCPALLLSPVLASVLGMADAARRGLYLLLKDSLDLPQRRDDLGQFPDPDRAPLALHRPELPIVALFPDAQGQVRPPLVLGQADPHLGAGTAGKGGETTAGVGGRLGRVGDGVFRISPHGA